MNINIISRGKGKSAVAAAAYRAGELIKNEHDGELHDYTKKKGIAFTEIMLPDHAPSEFYNRAVLWNAVEKSERAKNAQLCREVRLALPAEFNLEQNAFIVHEYVRDNFVSRGMCADICIHDKQDGNPHAHILLTMRPLEQDGTWGAKSRMEYILDENGERIKLPSGRYKVKKITTTDWDNRDNAEVWRENWAATLNKYLEHFGHEERVDHRSFERQGLEILPTIHLGFIAHGLEQKGIATERGDINRAIKSANAEIENNNAKLQELEAELQRLKDEQLEEPSTAPAPFEGYTKPFTAELEKKLAQSKIDTPTPIAPKLPNPVTPKSSKAIVKTEAPKNAKPKTSHAPVAKPKTAPAPTPKPKTLKEVNREIRIIDNKLSDLEHAEKVIMGYDHSILDIRRNLSSAGFFERRKMQKEIATKEQQRDDYQKNAEKKYGIDYLLENEKDNLLIEKKQIEDATGITDAREHEQQRKRDAAIQKQQDRDRYNAERNRNRATPAQSNNEHEI